MRPDEVTVCLHVWINWAILRMVQPAPIQVIDILAGRRSKSDILIALFVKQQEFGNLMRTDTGFEWPSLSAVPSVWSTRIGWRIHFSLGSCICWPTDVTVAKQDLTMWMHVSGHLWVFEVEKQIAWSSEIPVFLPIMFLISGACFLELKLRSNFWWISLHVPYLVALTQKAIEVVSRGWSWILRLSHLSPCCITVEVNPIELVLVLFLTIELKLHLLRYTSWDLELKEAVALSLEINGELFN